MIHLLIINDTPSCGGLEKNLEAIGCLVDPAEVKVSYLYTRPVEHTSDRVHCLNFRLLRQNKYTRAPNILIKAFHISRWLATHDDINMIMVSNFEETLAVDLARSMFGVKQKFIIYNQMHVSSNETNADILTKILVRWFARANGRADAVLALSNGIIDDLKQTYRVNNMFFVHSSMFDFDALHEKAKVCIDEAWLLKDQRKTILFVGRLANVQKRVDVLLRAAELLIIKGLQNFKVVIVGDGGSKTELEALAITSGLQKIVYFLGHKDNPYPYFKLADVFVLPSDFEGFGNVIVEAMSFGLPVVATDCPSGPGEILDGGNYGMLVPLDNSNAIAEVIHKLFSDVACYESFREKSIERASFYEGKRTVKALTETLKSIKEYR